MPRKITRIRLPYFVEHGIMSSTMMTKPIQTLPLQSSL